MFGGKVPELMELYNVSDGTEQLWCIQCLLYMCGEKNVGKSFKYQKCGKIWLLLACDILMLH